MMAMNDARGIVRGSRPVPRPISKDEFAGPDLAQGSHPGLRDSAPLGRLLANDFVQTFYDHLKLLGRQPPKKLAEPLGRESTNLTDLHPRALGKRNRPDFKRKREADPWLLAGDGQGDDSPGALIEDIVAQNKNRSSASLFPTSHRIEVRPEDIASQYSGHSASLT